jgi:hypothetical protein
MAASPAQVQQDLFTVWASKERGAIPALLSYGDSALIEDTGDASLVMALVEAIKQGEDLRLDAGTYIFADTRDVVAESVMGSPVLRSPSVFEAWLAARGLTYEEVRPRRQGRTEVPKAQMRLGLFVA